MLQILASLQKRTSPIKFTHLAEKSENGSTSNLSTKRLGPQDLAVADLAVVGVRDAAEGLQRARLREEGRVQRVLREERVGPQVAIF